MGDPQLLARCQARCGSMLDGKWRLEAVLGVGGMAAVYVATHTIGRREAIKILHPHFASVPELVARFEREARAVNTFRHPGAVDIRDIGRTPDGCPYLVLELLEGETLGQRVTRLGGLPREELFRYADQLCDVLGAAHASGIVHRDLKLENLFVTREGRLKVLDFGVAHMAQQRRLTLTGDVIGTLAYMAPEQVAGFEVDARTDLFAVGVILFRILAGRRVHVAESEESLVLAMGLRQAPAIRTVTPDVEPALAAIIDRALQFKKEDRFESAAAMRAALAAAAGGVPAQGGGVGRSAAAPSRGARSWLPLAVAAALLIGLGGAGVWVIGRARAAPETDSEDAADTAAGAHAGKRKKRTKAAASASATATPSIDYAKQTREQVARTARDFTSPKLGEIGAMWERRVGADARIVRTQIFPHTLLLDVITKSDPSHLDTLMVETDVMTGALKDGATGHGSEDAAVLSERSFSLGEVPWAALQAMGRDALARTKEKDAKINGIVCERRSRAGRSALAELICTVFLASDYKSENFSYRTDGSFIDPAAERKKTGGKRDVQFDDPF